MAILAAMSALLDNPIWNALTTHQARFAQRAGDAARFDPAVTLLAGFAGGEATPAAQAALAGLLGDDRVGLFLPDGQALDPSLERVDGAPIAQMVHAGPQAASSTPIRSVGDWAAVFGRPVDRCRDRDSFPVSPASEAGLVPLGADDVPEMMALAALTRPGPFGPRTRELGDFLGVREGDRLIAMAGQRMRLDGMMEISAVCTHPDFAGRGHGARLMAAQLARVRGAGAIPFLHVRADNAGAIGLYQRLGFAIRREFRYLIVRAGR